MTTATADTKGQESARLARRRDKLRAARAGSEAAQAVLVDLGVRAEATGRAVDSEAAGLRAAQAEVARRKMTLKRVVKECEKLQIALRKAAKRAAADEKKLRAIEARYDKAMLAEMVRREKESDLARHTRSGASAEYTSSAGARSDRADEADPGADVARTTAAKTTEARAAGT